jgi:hypothetical protein
MKLGVFIWRSLNWWAVNMGPKGSSEWYIGCVSPYTMVGIRGFPLPLKNAFHYGELYRPSYKPNQQTKWEYLLMQFGTGNRQNSTFKHFHIINIYKSSLDMYCYQEVYSVSTPL